MIYLNRELGFNFRDCNLQLAMRKASSKRTFPLEVTPAVNIGTRNLFFGFEAKKALYFTRIKTSIEKLLPKIIIKIDGAANNVGYKIRFGILSSIIFVAFTIIWLMVIVASLAVKNVINNIVIATIIYIFYLMLIYIEYKLTLRSINKAVKLVI